MQSQSFFKRKYDTESLGELSLVIIQSINSGIMYLASFFTYLLLYQLITSIAATGLGISHTIHFADVNFDNYHGNWGRINVIATFGSGPLVCLMVAMVSLIVFNRISRKKGFLKFYLLWMVLHGLNFFFGAMIMGVITKGGFGYVPAWVTRNEYVAIGAAIASVFPLLFFGIVAGRPFLQLIPRIDLLDAEELPNFCFGVIFGPYLMALPIIFIFFLPHYSLYAIGLLLTMSFLLFPAYLMAKSPRTASTGIAKQPEIMIAWNYAAALGIMMLLGKYLDLIGFSVYC